MKEIKFRVWDKVNKKYWENIFQAYAGNLHELSLSLSGRLKYRTIQGTGFTDEGFVPETVNMHTTIDESLFKDRFILQQFTGLQDKNEKEIYEGDIVKCFRYWNNPEEYTVVIEDIRKLPLNIFGSELVSREVVGNIFENPELLKGENNEK